MLACVLRQKGDRQPEREGRMPTEASYWFSRPRFCDRCSPAPTLSLTTVDAHLPRALWFLSGSCSHHL